MSRETTLLRGGVVGVLTALVHVLVIVGVIPVGAEDAATGIVDAVGGIIALLLIRAGVTPVSDPRAADGTPLVPASTQRQDLP